MKHALQIFLVLYILAAAFGIYSLTTRQGERQALPVVKAVPTRYPTVEEKEAVAIVQPPPSYVINQPRFISQTFNNCGPASLSMVMGMLGREVSQQELGQKMRPYQVPGGDNDDKSIFAEEFVKYAKEYGFESLHRPNGTVDLLKKFTANDIPVVVRTWLNPNEDIGHFRIVRGYDDERRVIIQDDSYQGANLEYSYETFSSMWQPFNYGYILVYPSEKQAVVAAILEEEVDEKTAWVQARERAEQELQREPGNMYPQFNISTAAYYLGDYQASVTAYEKIANKLPFRMLWYQIEPIQAYFRLGNSEVVFSLTDSILQNHNRAFSELYQIRGEIYVQQGEVGLARQEFEKAVFYNNNFVPAQDSLKQL